MKLFLSCLALLFSIQNAAAYFDSDVEAEINNNFIQANVGEIFYLYKHKNKMPNIYSLYMLINEHILPESAEGFYEAGDKDLANCMKTKQNPNKLWKKVLSEYSKRAFKTDDTFVIAELMLAMEDCLNMKSNPNYNRKNMMEVFNSSFYQGFKKSLVKELAKEEQ